MTQETSVLKSKLGLENLKGLGETLKEIKEVKESLDDTRKTIAELASDNNPLGRALAQLIEAQGIKALKEDDVNLLEEVKNKMEDELKERGQKIEDLEAKNRALEEDRIVQGVKEALNQHLPQSGDRENGGSEGKLFKALESVVADYLEKRLAGGGESNLTSEQIRSIVKEEVGQAAGGNKRPEDMIDDIVNAVTMGDRLRDKLGLPGGGGNRLLPAAAGESNLRTDLVKALLEDERERLKIDIERESHLTRNKHIGTLVGTFKENAEDIIGATRDLSRLIEEERGKNGADVQESPQGFSFQCGQCGDSFNLDEEPQGEFPCPGCGAKLQIKKPGLQVASSLEI